MRNLAAELLFKLTRKEEESKGLCVQVEALEIIVTAMLRDMAQNDQQRLIDQIEGALYEVEPDAGVPNDDTELLHDYVKELLEHPRQWEVSLFNSCRKVVTAETYSRFVFIF